MKKLIIGLTAFALAVSGSVFAQTLEELARIVEQAATSEGQINQQREAEFLSDRNEQRNLLAQARRDLKAEETRGDNLKAEYDRRERELAELETVLQERMGNLGELFGIVRQSSGDIQSSLDDSMVSSALPGRSEFLSELAQRKELPNVPELRQVWSRMVTEIAQGGRVVKYTTSVERTNGEKQDLEVVRVGVFTAVTNGAFLDWDPSKSKVNFIELARQPAARFGSMASDLQSAAPGEMVDMAVDFSRGQILRAVVQSKSPIERVKEDGGPVGYVIIGVGVLGLLLCFW
jgi:biopolymer transport protein ExbB